MLDMTALNVTHEADYSDWPYTLLIPRHLRPHSLVVLALLIAAVAVSLAAQAQAPLTSTSSRTPGANPDPVIDRDAERWVTRTLRDMTLDQKIGQLIVVGIESGFTPTDSDAFTAAARAVREQHIGGVIVFGVGAGAAEPAGPALGNPLSTASTLNRLQELARVPLLAAADFEFGVGMRIGGGTAFPRAMAFGAAGDPALVEQAARATAGEARAIGIHVNLAPVTDVNNNVRNPVINTRAFGETPEQVGPLAVAYVRALQAAGMLATVKHFPGHGDTDVDSHLGLPLISHSRDRLNAIELPPFRAAIDAGVAAVMTSHIELPALEPQPQTPATFSHAIATGLLRQELGFDGLVFTDSMKMAGLARIATPREAAVRAVLAGHDLLLDVPDAEEAFFALGAAIETGDLSLDRLDQSVTRILRAKARLGLHRQRLVPLDAVPAAVGSRAARAVAASAGERAVTLIRDDQDRIPLAIPPGASVLLLSVVDYPAGWGASLPGRVLAQGLRTRWPRLTVVEVSDRTPDADLEKVLTAGRYDAVVAGVFVRTISGSGRMHLPPPLARLVNELGRGARADATPMAAVLFGNPYVATMLEDVPALLLAYDYSELAERSAVGAMTGAAAVNGRLPITLSAAFPAGHGLARSPR